MNPQISLPAELHHQIQLCATKRGVSVDDFILESLKLAILVDEAADPLFEDARVFDGDAPKDIASQHDDYLYGDNQ